MVEERTKRADEVVRQISGYSGGQQTFLGPTLVVPYRDLRSVSNSSDVYVIFPASASAVLRTVTEERSRSLFKVPVFRADLKFEASFDLTAGLAAPPAGIDLDWEHAEIVIGVTDVRGALDEATLSTNGKTAVLVPAQALPSLTFGADGKSRPKVTLLGTAIDAAKPGAKFEVTSSMRFSGAQRIALLSYGTKTQVSAQGDWPSPGFDGGFLPNRRKVTASGYTAEWSIPFIARGVRAAGPINTITGLEATDLGTSFIEVADPYQSVNRCLKYVLLFVGLVFLSYFVLEVVTGKRIHPAQYILVGVVQIIFYLLLLSFAEKIGFDWAFAVAGASTVALLSTNAGWVFSSLLQGLRALVTFTLLYIMIFLLLRAEDYGLLTGAIASFIIVAVAMYLTRKIDWYSPLSVPDPPNGRIPPPSPEPATPQD
ncbi:MAG TPA: cell envelope integrity protein CreD [Candidatus Solibacter sp.]|nr:cell envelope integrity protein CreD [Candidatus Solibacter sp.]